MRVIFLIISILWTIAWWFIAWSRIPVLTEYSFFPLWVGYILIVNAFSEAFFGDSLLRKMGWSFIWLFAASAPFWWFFEYLNSIVQNWHYLYRPISQLHYILNSFIDFSTVIPAVLSTAFLFQYLLKGRNWAYQPIAITNMRLVLSVLTGVASFCVMPFFPNETFPLVWIAPLLVIDPLNFVLGLPSVLSYIKSGKWLVPISIMLATLFTGFWWEMWNFYSYPKWYYTIPYVGFWKVFEMPLLGYGGYLFLGLIIWSFAMLIFALWNRTFSSVLPLANSDLREGRCDVA
jgi:hypothetical protein